MDDEHALSIEELRDLVASENDELDRPWWMLSVHQHTATAGGYGAMQKLSATFIEDVGPLAFDVAAQMLDARLLKISGELAPDRQWSISEELLTPRDWLAAHLHELEEAAADG